MQKYKALLVGCFVAGTVSTVSAQNTGQEVYPAEDSYQEIVIVNGYDEVIRTIDGGKSWTKESREMVFPERSYMPIEIHTGYGETFTTVDGGVVWTKEKPGQVETAGIGVLPEGLSVTVAPNPAADRAEIRFALDQPANVSLSVYSFAGERIVHTQQTLSAGDQILPVSLLNVSAGVYHYTLTTGAFSAKGSFIVRK